MRPSTGMPDYTVTKAAVLSLSRLVADLYAGDGIRCNAITPGPTATEAWLGEGGLADQQAIERLLRPVQGKGDLHHIGEGEIADLQPDLPPKAFEDHLRRLSGPPYLKEVLKLQFDRRRD